MARIYAIQPPAPEQEVQIKPSEVAYVQTKRLETILRQRPWIPNRRIATLGKKTRLVVRGVVPSRDPAGCRGEDWYAIAPFGFVCSRDVVPTDKPPSSMDALQVRKGKRLPIDYVSVRDHETPMYDSVKAIREGAEPARLLERRMTLALDRFMKIDGVPYVRTKAGNYVQRDLVYRGGQGSKWRGVRIDGKHVGPSFGWITPKTARTYKSPGGRANGSIKRRTRVPILEVQKKGRKRWLRIDEKRWVASPDVNEVHLIDVPQGVLQEGQKKYGTDQWFDVDVGEQVLVAYRGSQPIFATLVSSGRAHPTPLGNYPVWAKVGSMTMANQGYEDNAYMVQAVPWVLLFQGHNAFHGAYWHDQFGIRKSHGCVNLSPYDARFVFEWAGMRLLEGWTGYLPTVLDSSVMVHVRNSSKKVPFEQERPAGPPDPEEEREKMKEAEERRAAEAEAEAAAAAEAEAAAAAAAEAAGQAGVPVQPVDPAQPAQPEPEPTSPVQE